MLYNSINWENQEKNPIGLVGENDSKIESIDLLNSNNFLYRIQENGPLVE